MKSLKKTLISLSLVGAMLAASPLSTVKAAADGEGKYVSEVYVAYGANEHEAAQWLKDNGWEPVLGDLGAGKASVYDTDVAAVMGIHRTGNANDAITDMAVMNMKGAYSFDMYTEIVNEKKTEINAFLDSFTPTLEEYRANLNGEGSDAGKARAELVRDLLNKFYDGEVDGEYALNDTGKPLGDLLASTTKHEFGDEAYDALSKEDKLKYGDLQQILLESTPEAVLVVERLLSLATDGEEDSWLDRLYALQEGDFEKVLEVIDEDFPANGSDSVIKNYISSKYEDTAIELSEQWQHIHDEMAWYLDFTEENGLTKGTLESDKNYSARLEEFFDKTKEEDITTSLRYDEASNLFSILITTEFAGEWGDSLLDFFLPADDVSYAGDFEKFTIFAAALSEGQRAALSFLDLSSLIRIGMNDLSAIKSSAEEVKNLVSDMEQISIYSGMKRQIFRDGVALTSEALAEKYKGQDPYESIFDVNGWVDIAGYATIGVGLVGFVSSTVAYSLLQANITNISNTLNDGISGYSETVKKLLNTSNPTHYFDQKIQITKNHIKTLKNQVKALEENVKSLDNNVNAKEVAIEDLNYTKERLENTQKELTEIKNASEYYKKTVKPGEEASAELAAKKTVAGTLMVVGGILMMAGAGVKAYSYLNNLYNKDFTKIPLMIVDEADIVTYRTDSEGKQILDENGKPIRDINFDQFAYYDAVKCNRQIIGVSSDAQNGVESYAEWGCGDVADLNCDYGMEWLALYTNKSSAKGKPILADSLTVQYGSNTLPKNCTKSLHTFRNTYAFNTASDSYSYNDNMKGIYLFWNEDPEAFGTAASAAGSVFNSGLAALFGVGGLGLGVLGTMLVMMPRRKREEV